MTSRPQHEPEVLAVGQAPRDLHVYSLAPIDFWEGWRPAAECLVDDPVAFEYPDHQIARSTYERMLRRAERMAAALGWEGDKTMGPYIAGLPNPSADGPAFMIGWKQSNNGTTFIASPYPLPWLVGWGGHTQG